MSLSPVAFAYGAGLLAAFNPCGFVLLPTYAAAFLANGPRGGTRVVLGVAGKLLAGFLAVFTALGVLVGAAGASVSSVSELASWLGVVTGALLLVAGVVLLFGGKLPGVRLTFGSTKGAFSYGVGYAVASLACALPVFLSAVVYAFDRGGFLEGILSGVAYAAGMGTVTSLVVVLTASTRRGAVNRLRGAMRFFNPLAGVLMVLAGVVLVVRRWFQIGLLEGLSARTVDTLDAFRWLPPALLLGVLAVVFVLHRRARPTRRVETDETTAGGDRIGTVEESAGTRGEAVCGTQT